MEAVRSFLGTDVYSSGKVIGRVTDFLINTKNNTIGGIECLSKTGIIRSKFFVDSRGIRHVDKNGIVIDKNYISYKKQFNEEFAADFAISHDNRFSSGSVGDFYFDPITFKLNSVSVKNGFLDDLIFGRDIIPINDVSVTNKGMVILKNRRDNR